MIASEKFGRFEDIPPRGDWDRHFDILHLGMGDGYTTVVGQAACGCMWELKLRCLEGSPSFRQMFDYFGARFTFNGHTEEHALECESALPLDFQENTKVEYGTTVADILRQQP